MICYCCGAERDEAGTHFASEIEAENIWRCHADPFIKILPKGKSNGKQAKTSA